MPLKFALICFVVLAASLTSFAQKTLPDSSKMGKDSTSKTDSAINKVSSKLDELIARINADKNDQSEITGVIKFDTLNQVPIFSTNEKKTARSFLIDKVTLEIKDGYIIDVNIYSGNRHFTNWFAPIAIDARRFSLYKRDFLYNINDTNEIMILQQAVTYESFRSFYPEDKLVTLSRKAPSDTLKKNVGVNTVLDLRLYTDALAALGNEPNGLFQTDIRVKQFLHRSNYWNKGFKIFQTLKLNLTASKLDSKTSFVDSSDRIPRMSLYQRAKFHGEVAVNLCSSWLGKKTLNDYYFDFGVSYHTVNLAGLKDTSAIHVPGIFLEGGINLRNSSNIGFDFYMRYGIQFSPQTDYNKQDEGVTFLKTGAEVYWNPFGDAANRVFGRMNYVLGLSLAEKKNSFTQVQIGYSTLLSKAIGKK